jgi:hypothetical protein
MSEKKATRAPCSLCHRDTKHKVLSLRVTEGSEEIEEVGCVHWRDRYEMLECCGCESVKLRHSSWFSGTDETTVTYYPPPISRPLPPWRFKLPFALRSLIDEIYTALHADSRRLALMGARTALDMILLEKVGDVGSFPQKLQALQDQGFIGKRSCEVLTAALDAGSAAAHRGYRPNKDHLAYVMDIVENVLQAVYVLEGAAAELRKKIPKREKK